MRKLIVSNSFLSEAAELLKEGKSVKLHIDGQSMLPFIRGGKDLVEIMPCLPGDNLPPWCCPFYCWEGKYMIHRLIEEKEGICRMMGDGNIYRVEEVRREEIFGVLRYIYRPNGTTQDCMDEKWLNRARLWYRLRGIRRLLLPLIRRF